MPNNKQIDRLVGEKVRKFKVESKFIDGNNKEDFYVDDQGQYILVDGFTPSTDLNLAMQALRQWKSEDCRRDWRLQSDGDDEYVVLFDNDDLCAQPDIMITTEDKSLALAICKALLQAVGEKV